MAFFRSRCFLMISRKCFFSSRCWHFHVIHHCYSVCSIQRPIAIARERQRKIKSITLNVKTCNSDGATVCARAGLMNRLLQSVNKLVDLNYSHDGMTARGCQLPFAWPWRSSSLFSSLLCPVPCDIQQWFIIIARRAETYRASIMLLRYRKKKKNEKSRRPMRISRNSLSRWKFIANCSVIRLMPRNF